jgi:hypothetical protein
MNQEQEIEFGEHGSLINLTLWARKYLLKSFHTKPI